jgi:hypothetical protein
MVLHNDTDETATVSYRYPDAYDGSIQTGSLVLAPGHSKAKALWLTAPQWLDVDAKFGIWRVRQRILRKEFPANVLAGPSGPTLFHVHVTRKEVAVNGPTFWDRFGPQAVFASVCLAIGLGAMAKFRRAPVKAKCGSI